MNNLDWSYAKHFIAVIILFVVASIVSWLTFPELNFIVRYVVLFPVTLFFHVLFMFLYSGEVK